ncbi:uncharacterized protein LOC126367079 [Pectinophora gossypiella]|uniref:uncharacterized protein LOC126367079 n=1 Tax=Pectinophora gossypiella TaxID=13191 RepID=UPI00214E2CD4|nr:uncharacterized protein LOC126367079 [Pectinophora gossypiella]
MTTCQLYPECPAKGSNTTFDDIPIEHSEDEHEENIKLVRKMLERRHIMLFPKAKLKNDKIEVESLKHYFDNLRFAHQTRTTKVYNPHSSEDIHKKKVHSRKSMFWELKKGAHQPFRPKVREEPNNVVVMGTGYNFPSSIPTTTPFRRF